jgi:hypothetical protein
MLSINNEPFLHVKDMNISYDCYDDADKKEEITLQYLEKPKISKTNKQEPTKLSELNDLLIDLILQYEPIEENIVESFRELGKLISFDFMSSDKATCYFTVTHRNTNKEILPNSITRIKLFCVKGSLVTFLWNSMARIDEEFIVSLEPTVNLSSQGPVNVIPLNSVHSSLRTFYDNGNTILWHIKGNDAINKRISTGFMNWYEIKKIQVACNLVSIGPLAFAKLLGRFLIMLPLFSLTQKYLIPMPIAFMYVLLFFYITFLFYF